MSNLFEAYAERHIHASSILNRVSKAVERCNYDEDGAARCLSGVPRYKIGSTGAVTCLAEDSREAFEYIENALSREEVQSIKECCQEIRLQLLSGLIAVSNSRGSRTESTGISLAMTVKEPGSETICHLDSGLAFASVYGVTAVLLPSIGKIGCTLGPILDNLLYVYDHTSVSSIWLIDMSMVEKLPISLLGSMLEYQHLLRNKGGDLFFCWLRSDVLPPRIVNKLVSRNDLVLRANHYFSRPWAEPNTGWREASSA